VWLDLQAASVSPAFVRIVGLLGLWVAQAKQLRYQMAARRHMGWPGVLWCVTGSISNNPTKDTSRIFKLAVSAARLDA